jgi:SAM-dependent methyltransferase
MARVPAPVSRFTRPVVAVALAAFLLPLSTQLQAQKGGTDGSPPAAKESFEPQSGQAGKDVIWVPTPTDVVEAMLDMASVKAGDKLVDLGAGDGRIAIAAAKRGAQATGIEYNPDMVALSQRNAARAGVSNVKFVQGDIFASDFSDADVVTMYLLPALNERLRPQLLDMKPGTRLASHQFPMGNWKPDARQRIGGHDALFWIVPAKVGGTWQVAYKPQQAAGDLRLELKQEFQQLEGTARWGAEQVQVSDLKLTGGDIAFTISDSRGQAHKFAAKAGHDGRMSGNVTGPDGKSQPFTASRTATVGML